MQRSLGADRTALNSWQQCSSSITDSSAVQASSSSSSSGDSIGHSCGRVCQGPRQRCGMQPADVLARICNFSGDGEHEIGNQTSEGCPPQQTMAALRHLLMLASGQCWLLAAAAQ